jgi:hypothetical protein
MHVCLRIEPDTLAFEAERDAPRTSRTSSSSSVALIYMAHLFVAVQATRARNSSEEEGVVGSNSG